MFIEQPPFRAEKMVLDSGAAESSGRTPKSNHININCTIKEKRKKIKYTQIFEGRRSSLNVLHEITFPNKTEREKSN